MKPVNKFLNRRWIDAIDKVNNKRDKIDQDDFINLMNSKGFDVQIVSTFIDQMLNYLPEMDYFPLHPKDKIVDDYTIDDEDFGDLLLRVFKEYNITWPSTKNQEKFYQLYGEDVTVEKMIQFICYFDGLEKRSSSSPPEE